MSPLSVAVVFGTRPEAIKLMPVVRELRRHADCFETHVVATAQHRELLDLITQDFGIVPDVDLDLMRHDQSPAEFAAAALGRLDGVFATLRPDWVIVQGDTTTTLAGALAAFWQRARVCHVEAGLRSGNRRSPFPEEMHRRLITQIADLHCAPTTRARDALLAEGVETQRIVVTGNTVVDALHWMLDEPAERGDEPAIGDNETAVLVTVHRRENLGQPLLEIIEAVQCIVAARPDVSLVWPVHPNPRVAEVVRAHLAAEPRVMLTEPLPYRRFVQLLQRSRLVLTDSGGIQEEIAVLGRRALVLRHNTERPEAMEGGGVILVAPEANRITETALRLLASSDLAVNCRTVAAFGDGRAAGRVAKAIRCEPIGVPRRHQEEALRHSVLYAERAHEKRAVVVTTTARMDSNLQK